MIGKRFGRLTIVQYAGENYRGISSWICECDCGDTIALPISHLRKITSCGCIGLEPAKITPEVGTGQECNSLMRKVWLTMKALCYKQNARGYEWYGGSGVRVYRPWRVSYETWYGYVSILPNCDPRLAFVRIDPSGHYEPGNVRWIHLWKSNRMENLKRFKYIYLCGKDPFKKLANYL